MTLANPYLLGNYAPVASEETVTDLSVTGTLPSTLNGRYLRNGPNPITPPDPATYHWFTGDGMVHGIRIEDGKARWYRNRWVRSAEVATALGENRTPGRSWKGWTSRRTPMSSPTRAGRTPSSRRVPDPTR